MPEILFFPVIIAFALVIASIVFWCFPPKKINHYYGYRTPKAFRNQSSWDFAQRYSTRLLFLLEACCTIICGAFWIAVNRYGLEVKSQIVAWIYYALPAIAALLMIALTELALAKMAKKEASEQ